MKKIKHRENMIPPGKINMAPIIDCTFLLLIFFMVTTAFDEVIGLTVDLPTANQNQEEQQQQKKDVNIFIASNGDYQVGGNTVSPSDLQAVIKEEMDKANNHDVIISADNDAKNEAIVYALDMAKGAGAENAAFTAESGSQ